MLENAFHTTSLFKGSKGYASVFAEVVVQGVVLDGCRHWASLNTAEYHLEKIAVPVLPRLSTTNIASSFELHGYMYVTSRPPMRTIWSLWCDHRRKYPHTGRLCFVVLWRKMPRPEGNRIKSTESSFVPRLDISS